MTNKTMEEKTFSTLALGSLKWEMSNMIPHLFDIKKGIAVVKQEEDCLDNGDYLVMNPAKVIFMLE